MGLPPSPLISQTKLSLLSAATVLCGEKPLSSLTDQRYAAQVGAAMFDMLYESELQSNRWRFACKKAQLALVNSTPPNEWQYVYQLPTDMLLPIGFWGIGPDRSYEIYSDKIFTNVTSNPGPINSSVPVLTFDYMFKPDVSTVPSYFNLLMTYALYRDMVGPITSSEAKVQVAKTMYNGQRNTALYADAQGRPNRQIQQNPFTQVR